MKRGGHVAGRRCSRCLCDSVQIHPTLKRRMSKKRGNGGWILWAHKSFSSTAKNPPAVGQKPRRERMNHEGGNSAGLFPHAKKKRRGSSHGTLSLHCSSDSPVRSAILHSGEELLSVALALQPRGIHPFLLILSKTSESHPLNLPAAAKHPPKRHSEWRQSKRSAFDNTDISLLCHKHLQTQSIDKGAKQKIPTLGAYFVWVLIKYRAELGFGIVLASVDSSVRDAFALSVVNRSFIRAGMPEICLAHDTRARTHTQAYTPYLGYVLSWVNICLYSHCFPSIKSARWYEVMNDAYRSKIRHK